MGVQDLIDSWEARREEAEERMAKHFPDGDDLLAIVLRGHLLCEEAIDKLNRHCFHFPAYYDQARLSFSNKVLIARAQVLVPHADSDQFFAPLDRLNTVRNSLAHNLESPGLEKKCEAFLETVESHYPENSEVHSRKRPSEIEGRMKAAIAFVLGRMQVVDHIVEFMEWSREYGARSDEQH